MSKSNKKKTAVQEVHAQIEGVEPIPATIVEGSAEEVFPGQTEVQDAANTTMEDAVVTADDDTTKQPAKAAAPKPPKPSKRPYIPLIEEHLNAGDMAKTELLALILERYPEVNKNGASTFLTNAVNPKYSHWKDRVVTKKSDGKIIFADKIEAPVEAVPHAEAQHDARAE